jgi:hypothetical protein
MSLPPFFHRPQLAERITTALLQSAVGSALSSGLFLAAPRRTGKSSFLREDLRPALQARGAIVLYVDLWADRSVDPGELIVGEVRRALAAYDRVVARLARAAGVDKAVVGGVSFSLDRVGLGAEVSLSQALSALSDESGKTIVLIIDEAQQAVTSDKGRDALHALKAARDELNSSRHHGLRVLCTGSNRDKLAMLRSSKEQAFFGAPMQTLPALGPDFVAWFCAGVALAEALDPLEVDRLFDQAGRRPEIIGSAADTVRLRFDLAPAHIREAFAQAVQEQVDQAREQALRVLRALTPLQAAVFRVLAARGLDYTPFSAETLRAYATTLEAIAPDAGLVASESNVAATLGALQDKGLIWKESRGVYAVEDESILPILQQAAWLEVVPLREGRPGARE